MVKYIQIGIVSILIFLGVIFSLGASSAHEAKGIYYDNVKYSDNVHFYGVDGLNLKYSGDLAVVGDSYELTFDVVNDSGVDMIITDYYYNDDPYIKYELSYIDGSTVKTGDILEKDSIKTLRYVVTYENEVLEDNYVIDSSFNIHYDQKV